MKTLLPIIFFVLITPSVAFAQQNGLRTMPATDDSSPAPVATPFKTKAMREAEALKIRNQNRQQLCEKVTSQVNFRLNQYEATKDRYSQRYQGIAKQATASIERLKAAGCETAPVEAELKAYQEKIASFTAAFRDFQTQLGKGRELACSEDAGARGQLNSSRQRLTLVKNRASDLQQFVKNRLQLRLKAAVNSCESLKGASE